MTRNDLSEAIIAWVYEDEDKWLNMKSHIAGSASARGISGKRRDAYIYGAMRKRGWKPKRERINEIMDPASPYAARALSKEREKVALKRTKAVVKKGVGMWKKEVTSPHQKLKLAVKHYQHGRKKIKAGKPHGKVMMRRAKASIVNRAPPHAAAVAGGAVALLPGPTGVGLIGTAALAAKGTRLALAKRRATIALAKKK